MYCMWGGGGVWWVVDLVDKGDTKNPWLIAHQVKHHVYLGRASHMLSDKFFSFNHSPCGNICYKCLIHKQEDKRNHMSISKDMKINKQIKKTKKVQ